MIDPGSLQEMKDLEPFRPFRIHLSDGRSYDVDNPDLFVVMESQLFLAFPRSNRWTFISFQNITSVETPIAA
jgi:hypothetical protein